MNITCYILDDEYHSIEVLKTYIGKTEGLELLGYSTDPLKALNEVARNGGPMLTFLDVNMPELSGMEFSGMVSIYTTVIFTTSYPEYAVAAFEKEAFDYLLKPVSYERFFKAIQKVRKKLLSVNKSGIDQEQFFFIKTEIKGKLSRVGIADIDYIEAVQNYIKIHCRKQVYITYLTMDEIAGFLPTDLFSRIHRSFIVRNSRIITAEPGQLTMENKVTLPIGTTYRSLFHDRLNAALLKTKRKL